MNTDKDYPLHCLRCGKDTAWVGAMTAAYPDGREEVKGYAVVCSECHTVGPNRESPETAILAWNDNNQKTVRECPACGRDEAVTRMMPGQFFITCPHYNMTGPSGKSAEEALESWNFMPREKEIRRLDKSCSMLIEQLDYLAGQLEAQAICREKEVNGHKELAYLTREDWLVRARKHAEGIA